MYYIVETYVCPKGTLKSAAKSVRVSQHIRVTAVQPLSLPLQVHSREEAAAHDQGNDNARAFGDTNTLEHRGEPISIISQNSPQSILQY